MQVDPGGVATEAVVSQGLGPNRARPVPEPRLPPRILELSPERALPVGLELVQVVLNRERLNNGYMGRLVPTRSATSAKRTA